MDLRPSIRASSRLLKNGVIFTAPSRLQAHLTISVQALWAGRMPQNPQKETIMAALMTDDAVDALDDQRCPVLYSVMDSAFDTLPANVISDAADWQVGRQECADCIVS